MADYIPHTWTSGETITADKMNHLEQGIGSGGGGIFLVRMTMIEDGNSHSMMLDKTAGEIINASESGKLVLIQAEQAYDDAWMKRMSILLQIAYVDGIYRF
jgi:hypothetical protein